MGVCFLFIVSKSNVCYQEETWLTWLRYNSDIVTVKFHCDVDKPITSAWVSANAVPHTNKTDYMHTLPAYFALMQDALKTTSCQWFVFCTESCVPAVSPQRFRRLFFKHKDQSILKWSTCWWNPCYNNRANLALLPSGLQLGHDPWFVLCRRDVVSCVLLKQSSLFMTVAKGQIANESIFAILLHVSGKLKRAINSSTHLVDWSRPSSPTSPHLFSGALTERDASVIAKLRTASPFHMFLRKVDASFHAEALFPVDPPERVFYWVTYLINWWHRVRSLVWA